MRRRQPWCFLAQFSTTPCDGRLVRAHLIPRQQLRLLWESWESGRRPELDAALEPYMALIDLHRDERTWVWACGGPTGVGGHHGELDYSRTLRIPRAAIPEETEEIAGILGLVPWLDREYARG